MKKNNTHVLGISHTMKSRLSRAIRRYVFTLYIYIYSTYLHGKKTRIEGIFNSA